MKKFITLALFSLILGIALIGSGSSAYADWWQRPDARPSLPSIPREEEPTSTPIPTATPTAIATIAPTQPPSGQPSPTPTLPPIGGLPTTTPVPTQPQAENGGAKEDTCGPGKSYTGPYCGWSPDVDGEDGGDGGAAPSEEVGIGGPEVLGLSATGSGDLGPSDIILLTGVLCLLLYVRSKFAVDRKR